MLYILNFILKFVTDLKILDLLFNIMVKYLE